MNRSRIPSPARSQGPPVTPRRYKPRGPRSVGSPGRSRTPARLTAVIQEHLEQDSFKISPIPARQSILTDDTNIEEPRRKSWWKKLDESSKRVMEVLDDNKAMDFDKEVNELVDMEVLSQENKKNYLIDLPESSDGESISSIVIPQRKLFTQKENQPKKFTNIIDTRDAKLQNTNIDIPEASTSQPKKLFKQNPKPKSKPVFPAALLNITPNKTVNKTRELAPVEVKGQVRSLFGQRPNTKRKNMFADFIASESEEDISEIQPRVFGFQRQTVQTRRSSRNREPSPCSVTTEIDIDDWKLLPSSTMVENQLDLANTPAKRARLSKLSEAKESEVGTINTTLNKTKQSKKSISSNKSRNSIKDNKETLEKCTKVIIQGEDNKPIEYIQEIIENEDKEEVISLRFEENDNVEEAEELLESKKESSVEYKLKEVIMEREDKKLIHEQVITAHNCENNKAVVLQSKNVTNDARAQKSVVVQKETTLERENEPEVVKVSENGIEEVVQNSNEEAQQARNNAKVETVNKDEFNIHYQNGKIEIKDHQKDIVENEDIGEDISLRLEEDDTPDNEDTLRESYNKQEETIHESNKEKGENKAKEEKVIGERENEEETMQKSKKEKGDEAKNIDKQEEEVIKQSKHREEVIKECKNREEAMQESVNVELDAIRKHDEEAMQKTADDETENEDDVIESEIEEEVMQESENEKEIQKSKNEEEDAMQEVEYEEDMEASENEEEDAMQEREYDEQASENEEDAMQERENDEEIEASESEEEDAMQERENDEEIEASENEEEDAMQKRENDEEIEASENEEDAMQESENEDEQEMQESDKEEDAIQESDNVDEQEMQESDKEEDAIQESENEQEMQESDKEEEDAVQESENEQEDNHESVNSDNIQHDGNNEDDEQEIDSEEDHDENEQDVSHEIQEENDFQEEKDQDSDRSAEEVLQNNSIDEENVESEIQNTKAATPTEVSNKSHNTSNKKKVLNSPETILRDKTKIVDSFLQQGRNTSIRKTKSVMRQPSLRPSLDPARESFDSERNSSAEGSGWDSHRTTRKTLRKTFGKDFTPRKSLRALVMEKSAKRQTIPNAELSNFPLANSTELPDGTIAEDTMEESNHDVSIRTRQATLQACFEKARQHNREHRIRMQNLVLKSLKPPQKDILNAVANDAVNRRKMKPLTSTKPKSRSFKNVPSLMGLPQELIDDLNYKPPKRFHPRNASWITKRLYKFLETKLEPKYDYKSRVRAERLMETLYEFTKDTRRRMVADFAAIDRLKVEMARLNIVKTHFEFYNFFHEYMPREIRIKVNPDLVNNIPKPRDIFADIIQRNQV